MNKSPGSLAGGPGDCTSPHNNGTDYTIRPQTDNASPLRLTPDTLESVEKTHPFEGAILRLMVADGRVVLVDGAGGV